MSKTTYYPKLKRSERIKPQIKMNFYFDLINAFSMNKKPAETADFLQDLLTANEITNLAVRLRIAKLLLADKSYNEIHEETRASSATITKVSVWLQEKGEGFRKTISRLPVKYTEPKSLPKGPIEFHLPQLIGSATQTIIANKQNNFLKKFSKNIEGKKELDKYLREESNEKYSK